MGCVIRCWSGERLDLDEIGQNASHGRRPQLSWTVESVDGQKSGRDLSEKEQ